MSTHEEGHAICNRFHQSAKAAELVRAINGLVIQEDITFPPPELFPTGKKTARHGLVVRRRAEGNRPLVLDRMEWGFPGQRRGASGKMLDAFYTNARNLGLGFWAPWMRDPAQRCLVPFTHFAEPGPAGAKGDDGLPAQWWFSVAAEPVACFAGLWRPTDRGPAFAFCTTDSGNIVRQHHPKAMPAILHPEDHLTWLDAPVDEALALVRPYDGSMIGQVATPPLPANEQEVAAPEVML